MLAAKDGGGRDAAVAAASADGGWDAVLAAAMPAAIDDDADAVVAATPAAIDREAFASRLPQSVLRRIEAAPTAEGARLTWAVAEGEHVDGFNVYREDGARGLVLAGNEAGIEVANGEAVFHFVDAARSGAAATYWLGARSCSGSEALVGPIRVEASAAAAANLALTASPNPADGATRFDFTLPRAADVRLEVYDLQGRRVAAPLIGRAEAGSLQVGWALRDDAGRAVAPGLYFARLHALGRTLYTRVTVVGH